jgi:hypothetical protein
MPFNQELLHDISWSTDRGKEKSGPFGPLEKRQEREEISGKAMQDEVEAIAKTLGLEKTTILEEG